MKTLFFVFGFVVLVPLFCEENALLGIRMYYNSSKGFFHFNGETKTIHIIAILVCLTLCLLHTIIAFGKWRKKLICLNRGRYGGFNYDDRNFPESNAGVTIFLNLSGEYLSPNAVAGGTLIGLNGGTLEMMIWFILHDQLRVNLRILRLFPINHRAPVYTVEQILEGKTEEFRALQQFLFKDCGIGRHGIRNMEGQATMAAVSSNEAHENERCGEIYHEPCLAFEANKTVESPDQTKLHRNGDDCESGYEPANMIRKALTAIFSKVKKDAVKTDGMKDLQDCDEISSKQKHSSAALDCDSDAKEERKSVSKGCLNKGNEEEKPNSVNVSKPKKRVEDMIEMIQSIFGPCVRHREFHGDKGFLDQKMKKAFKVKSKQLTFHEDTMQKNFEEESGLYCSEMDEDVKKTIKAYYGLAGGFTTDVRDSSGQEQPEGKSAHDITNDEWHTLDSTDHKGINVDETFTAQTSNEFQEIPIAAKCSLGELQAETMFADMEKKADSRRTLLDCSEIAFGCGVAAITLFAAYRCFRC